MLSETTVGIRMNADPHGSFIVDTEVDAVSIVVFGVEDQPPLTDCVPSMIA